MLEGSKYVDCLGSSGIGLGNTTLVPAQEIICKSGIAHPHRLLCYWTPAADRTLCKLFLGSHFIYLSAQILMLALCSEDEVYLTLYLHC